MKPGEEVYITKIFKKYESKGFLYYFDNGSYVDLLAY
jgi:hypothetical protein